jgi:hypothetical protein
MQASGNTFAGINPHLSPKVSFSRPSISFPPCRLGEAVHQTLCLRNSGDTPVHFSFSAGAATGPNACIEGTSSSCNRHPGLSWFGPFGLVPSSGVLEPHGSQLVGTLGLSQQPLLKQYGSARPGGGPRL